MTVPNQQKSDTDDTLDICAERHHTPAEVAEMYHVSTDTVIRWFSKEAGVIAIGNDERLHKRRKKLLRIPHSVLVRFHEKNRTAK